jgi:hypothetical protein
MRFLAMLFAMLILISAAPRERYLVTWAMEANEFPARGEGHDFLAIFDLGASFGKLVAVVPTQTRGIMAHHTNETMPANHLLYASDFMASEGSVFNLSDVRHPHLAGSFGAANGYTHPHSFASLQNGHTLATYQLKGTGEAPGALVELDQAGRVIRTSDASSAIDAYVRPYGLLALENIDRAVTTSAPMMAHDQSAPTHVIQIWRLSDLKLLQTLPLPKPPRGADTSDQYPDDATLLEDGKTVMIKTSRCGLFLLKDVGSEKPAMQFAYDFGGRGCSGVPVQMGHYWIQALQSSHSIVALDISEPSHPVEVSHLYLGPRAFPHWISSERGTGNIVITGFGTLMNTIHFATVDAGTGVITLDSRSIDLSHYAWPDGWSGGVIPHGSVFYAPAMGTN